MKNELKHIVGKTAYWGQHTFEAHGDKLNKTNVVRIDVYRSFPSFSRKHEGTFFFNTKKQMQELSECNDKSTFRIFTGGLRSEKRVEEFLDAFKHITKQEQIS